MEQEDFFYHLQPLFEGVGADPSSLGPAWNYEIAFEHLQLHLSGAKSGRLLMATRLGKPMSEDDGELGWKLLEMNGFNQELPAFHHSATADKFIVLWVELQIENWQGIELTAMLNRFLSHAMQVSERLRQPSGSPKAKKLVPAAHELMIRQRHNF